MIKDITIGQYIPGETFVHKLDPRTKIILSILFIACLFIIDKFIGYVLIVAFILVTINISKIPFRFLYKGLKPVFFLIALTAALNIFMVKGGDLLFSYKFINIYEE
ncbi:MAG: energy-coupling factor transporter transmembrane component T family protein, partial [Clostridium sp.]